MILLTLSSAQPVFAPSPLVPPDTHSRNLIIVTIDGFRWQEVFSGADETLINNPEVTTDTALSKMLYWHDSAHERRKLLMPFLWNVLAKKGQLWGNRKLGSKMNTANIYSVSYPGYNEMLAGTTDLRISSNRARNNPNQNVLDHLNRQPDFAGRVAVFTSWNLFPYILNRDESEVPVNSGYEPIPAVSQSVIEERLNQLQEGLDQRPATRQDQISFLAARDYLAQQHPRVMLIGLGETDEFAHHGQYGEYLEQANRIDRMLADLWQWIQRTPGYRDQTTLLITTDHGRGSSDSKWSSHSAFIRGSSQTWMALIGPGIEAKGEVSKEGQLYQQELAAYMASVLGQQFEPASWSSVKRK